MILAELGFNDISSKLVSFADFVEYMKSRRMLLFGIYDQRRQFVLNDLTLVDANTLTEFPGFYFDANRDGQLTPIDALQVLNRIIAQSEAEFESRIVLAATQTSGAEEDDNLFIQREFEDLST